MSAGKSRESRTLWSGWSARVAVLRLRSAGGCVSWGRYGFSGVRCRRRLFRLGAVMCVGGRYGFSGVRCRRRLFRWGAVMCVGGGWCGFYGVRCRRRLFRLGAVMCVGGGPVRFLRRALPSPVIPVGRRDVCRGDFCTAPGAGTRLQRLLPTASGERVLSEADPGKFYFRRAEVVCVRRRCIGYFVRR